MRKLSIILACIVSFCLMEISAFAWELPVLEGLKTYSTLAEYEKVTGKRIEKFHEAPILEEKVAAGELPPVEERLPEEPLVVDPLEEIGQYGGELRGPAQYPTKGGWDVLEMRIQTLFRVGPDYKTIVPNIAKGWDFSDDYKTLTVYLRKGMKWSDGAPFTADDFLFWYEDIFLNEKLTPVKPPEWCPGGEPVKVEKVDDYTVRFKFAVPYPVILELMAVERGFRAFQPKHYLKKYHIKYNPEADKIAKKEGFDHWWQLFNAHGPEYTFTGNMGGERDPNLPTVEPFVLEGEDSSGNRYFKRNPYYWKVDIAGNQLPYVDKLTRLLIRDLATQDAKAIAWEFSHYGWGKLLSYPLYKTNEKKGNYHVVLMEYARGNEYAISFNYTHKDPVLRKIFNDIRFRQAMSLAINRQEINELVYFGKATPRQATVHPSCSFYEPWMGEYCAEYDPERANKLLDEMGLKWDKNHEYRLRPDGKTLFLKFHVSAPEEAWTKIAELVRAYWEDVGVKVDLKIIDYSLYWTRGQANELDLAAWAYDNTNAFAVHAFPRRLIGPIGYPNVWAAQPWYQWLMTNGKNGMEPPEDIKRAWKLASKWQQVPRGTEEYLKIGKEIATLSVKNLWCIGTIGMPLQPILIKNNLKNTPKKGLWDWGWRQWVQFQPDQWFFEKG